MLYYMYYFIVHLQMYLRFNDFEVKMLIFL